ncbi:MAG: cellulose synthase family protein, partial [Pseudomonadota bacterium]
MLFNYIIVGAYLFTLALLMLYCMHRYSILFLYFKYKRRIVPDPSPAAALPRVTVQLPVYNEMYVVRRLIAAVAELQYPKELLEIQVLDDSTDETSALAQACVTKLTQDGFTIHYMHRSSRSGFKAGALDEGLAKAHGDLIAIFDADFVPDKQFLMRTVPFFSQPDMGMVQTMWGHINRNYSALTQVQAMLLDAHFVLEHTARNRSGKFFNFNGTAGIWRKQCIIASGGWQHDTLTEDLDLSYRAQLQGWKFIFLPHVTTPGEIPIDINSFKSQQHRWAKGGIETALKLFPAILRSRQPLAVKLESFFHLSCNINYLLILLLSVLTYPALIIRIANGWKELYVADLIIFLAGSIPIALYYIISQKEVKQRWIKNILYLPLLMAAGLGLSINNGRGVIEALMGYKSSFLRTPKFCIEGRADTWKHKKYQGYALDIQIFAETAFGIYFLAAMVFALKHRVYAAIPFLLLFSSGFLYVALTSLYQK